MMIYLEKIQIENVFFYMNQKQKEYKGLLILYFE